MDIFTRKLILIAFFYDLSHFREMSGDRFGILVYDESVMTDNVLKKLCIIWKIFEQRLELFCVVFAF